MGQANTTPLNWSWVTTLPTETPPTLAGYGYAIYRDSVFETQGTLAADATSFSYTPSANGSFTFYIWAVEQGSGDALYCDNATTAFSTASTAPPVINGDSYTQKGNVATPALSTDETDVTFSWVITSGTVGGATISDPSLLTPTFTFSADGTYDFTLTVTDSFGNITTLIFEHYLPGAGNIRRQVGNAQN